MKVGGYTFGAMLGLIAMLPAVFAVGFVIGTRQKPAQPDWIFGPKQVLQSDDPNVLVYCQVKTTSLPFANHEHAVAGDVVAQTCRAVKKPG